MKQSMQSAAETERAAARVTRCENQRERAEQQAHRAEEKRLRAILGAKAASDALAAALRMKANLQTSEKRAWRFALMISHGTPRLHTGQPEAGGNGNQPV